ncbi:MAG: hypothetical protein DRP46_12535 [Candidatus Zixiibacteriota bacterium]|nr:MAG: hypothetical protein DRP46_12535 [candidate division Zixibacteria bacterium]
MPLRKIINKRENQTFSLFFHILTRISYDFGPGIFARLRLLRFFISFNFHERIRLTFDGDIINCRFYEPKLKKNI